MGARILRILLLVVVVASSPVLAERADRDKPTQIDADRVTAEELKQVVVYTGKVVLTKGTLRITGDRLELREDPEGYQYATVTAPPGGLATFRQRRDPTRPGIEEYIEASADRLEYNGRTETIKLTGHAQIRRIEDGQPRDEFSGGVITYNMRDSSYSGEGGTTEGGRTRTIIAPRSPATSSTPAPGVPLEPARRLDPERRP
ncbi:MAG: lipopolysaccharide transport periplasmic protein LptA [Gemmatimonadota bacterium]